MKCNWWEEEEFQTVQILEKEKDPLKIGEASGLTCLGTEGVEHEGTELVKQQWLLPKPRGQLWRLRKPRTEGDLDMSTASFFVSRRKSKRYEFSTSLSS